MDIPKLSPDLRDGLIRKRKHSIRNILIFTSGKGGVGKSTLSAHSAFILSRNRKVGILDIDLHGPSIPNVLKTGDLDFEESKNGLIPAKWNNIKIMSMQIFAGERGLPLRGDSKSDIIRDMFAITDFGELDYLVVDTPPGTGDEFMTSLEMFRGSEKLIFVSMLNSISWKVTKRAIDVARDMKAKIGGIVGNMGRDQMGLEQECEYMGLPYFGTIGYYPAIIDRSPEEVSRYPYMTELEKIVSEYILSTEHA